MLDLYVEQPAVVYHTPESVLEQLLVAVNHVKEVGNTGEGHAWALCFCAAWDVETAVNRILEGKGEQVSSTCMCPL